MTQVIELKPKTKIQPREEMINRWIDLNDTKSKFERTLESCFTSRQNWTYEAILSEREKKCIGEKLTIKLVNRNDMGKELGIVGLRVYELYHGDKRFCVTTDLHDAMIKMIINIDDHSW